MEDRNLRMQLSRNLLSEDLGVELEGGFRQSWHFDSYAAARGLVKQLSTPEIPTGWSRIYLLKQYKSTIMER